MMTESREAVTSRQEAVEEHLLTEIAELNATIERIEGGREHMQRRINTQDNEINRLRTFAPFTRVEAVRFIRDGVLPENLADRLRYPFVEAYECPNCDGRLCMGCVTRDWDHECANDCPFCCENGEVANV